MSMRHDVYLYVQMDEQVWRVNVSKLGDESQPRPEFELVSDNSNGELPIGMGCISVNSKLYMVGGQKEQQITKDDDDEDDDDSSSEVDYVPNLKSFVLNLDAHPSIRICQDLPSMNGPKFNPLVVSVNDKFYVLARRPICDYGKALDQPVFEVFDPAAVNGGSWKELPRPPWTDPAQFKLGGDYIYHHFVWGHKIVFCTRAGFYVFDTDMKKWDFTDEKLSPFPIISCASAEFDGFLIAMPWDRQQLVAYQLDSDSDATAKPCRVLDELRPVFNPPFARHEFQGFLTHLGDVDGGHRMCLLYAGYDYYSRWCARVANFRVSISCNDAGDRFPYAYLETLQHYDFEKFDNPARWIDSAFVMYVRGDYLNNHDVEANARFMDAYPTGSDECDYLNEPYDETNASLTDTYLCGSNECDYLNEQYDETNASLTDTYLCGSNEGDYLNNHDVEANARFMDAYPAGSDECDYLNEHYDETNASLTDTYLCGSNEGDYLNNHDVEANARFMDAYPAGSDECDYLNEHYDETNASLTDTYLCGSNEGDFLNNHDVEANARFMDAYPAGSDECDYLNELYDETNASLTDTYLCGSNVYYYLKKHEAVADASCRDAYLSRSDGHANLNGLNVEVDGSFMRARLSGSYRTREFDSSTLAVGGWHAVYSSVVGLLTCLIQFKFQDSDVSPFKTNSVSMRAFFISICTYGLAVVIRGFVQGRAISRNYSQIIDLVIMISVTLSVVSCVSLFVPNWLNCLLLISWLIFCVMVVLIMVVPCNFIHRINQWFYQITVNALLQVLNAFTSLWKLRLTVGELICYILLFYWWLCQSNINAYGQSTQLVQSFRKPILVEHGRLYVVTILGLPSRTGTSQMRVMRIQGRTM
ncbi:uncharacterized protein LOC114323175 isoform X8 [Camellia sinensis]|uniref:uncharacterized protein LOC114323175 isoform X8 n=1 Tax=Camellia sinensis TaxID=4442 RepID=UPI001036B774|nr:uncharacterized protein LOC114323175 isoform X8 [Camellia sinensis]